MLRKKKWIIIVVLAAVVVLLAVAIGGAAYAQTGSTAPATGKTLLARVATILGVDQKKIEDAFAQAQREMRAESLNNRLKAMVEQGKLTQQQADQYKQWWQSRPDVPAPQRGPRGQMGLRGGFPKFSAISPAPPVSSGAPK